MTKVRSEVMWVLSSVIMERSNLRIKNRVPLNVTKIESNAMLVLLNVTMVPPNVKKELLHVMLEHHNVRMESSSVRKK